MVNFYPDLSVRRPIHRVYFVPVPGEVDREAALAGRPKLERKEKRFCWIFLVSKCHCCQTFNVESAEPETRSLLSADQASWYTFCNDTYNVRTCTFATRRPTITPACTWPLSAAMNFPVLPSQRRMDLSKDAEARVPPSGEKRTSITSCWWPGKVKFKL